jgi:hypothetical protein
VLLAETASRLNLPVSSVNVVGFAPSGADAVAITLQANTFELQQVEIAAVLNAFLSNVGGVAVASLQARGLTKLAAVTLSSPASTSSSPLPTIYSASTAPSSLYVNKSTYYAMIGVGCGLVVLFLVCCLVMCCSSWGQQRGRRPDGPRAFVGAKRQYGGHVRPSV